MINSTQVERISTKPYDLEQIFELLQQLEELDEPVGSVVLKPSLSSNLEQELLSMLAKQ